MKQILDLYFCAFSDWIYENRYLFVLCFALAFGFIYSQKKTSIDSKKDNNGWVKIQEISFNSYNKLPELHKEYDFVLNGKIIYRYYYNGSFSDDVWIKNNVSHFRLSQVHELPKN